MSESALVVHVPEAEPLVAPIRRQNDPSALAGMPAHITVLYPFVPPGDIDPAVLDDLGRCVGGFASFAYSLGEIRRAPGIAYLAPDPAETFRDLTRAVWHAYPDFPPYGGRHDDILPHLTLAQSTDEQELEAVIEAFVRSATEFLPIRATALAVELWLNTSGK